MLANLITLARLPLAAAFAVVLALACRGDTLPLGAVCVLFVLAGLGEAARTLTNLSFARNNRNGRFVNPGVF